MHRSVTAIVNVKNARGQWRTSRGVATLRLASALPAVPAHVFPAAHTALGTLTAKPTPPRVAMQRYLSAQPAASARRMTVQDLMNLKTKHEKIVMITAYDAVTAQAMNDSADIVLVGDSLGMVVLGQQSTVTVTLEDMIRHCAAVSRGCTRPFIVCDMPFGSYATVETAVLAAHRLVKEGGATAVKLEGGEKQAAKVTAIAAEGIPVMGHVGLTPQTSPALSGYRVHGNDYEEASQLTKDAVALEKAGAFAVVLEKVPAEVAELIQRVVHIPTIGIGAGPATDGQVLVCNDLVGFYPKLHPKFAKRYANIYPLQVDAFAAFASEVKAGSFPGPRDNPLFHYRVKPELRTKLASLARDWGFKDQSDAPTNVRPIFTAARPFRTAIVGTGALSFVYAARLSTVKDCEVVMCASSTARAQQLARQATRVYLGEGASPVMVTPAVIDLSRWHLFQHYRDALMSHATVEPLSEKMGGFQEQGSFDAVLLLNKAVAGVSATAAALALIKPFAGDQAGGIVVPLYNGGFTHEFVRSAFAHSADSAPSISSGTAVSVQQVVDGITYTAACPGAPLSGFDFQQTAVGETLLGTHEMSGAFADLVHAMSLAGLKPLQSPDFAKLRAMKIVVNAVLNPTMALAGLENGHFAHQQAIHEAWIIQLCSEAALALKQFEPLPSPFFHGKATPEAVLALVSSVAQQTSKNVCSTLADLRAGRPTEIPFINGWIAANIGRSVQRADHHQAVVEHFGEREALMFGEESKVRAAETLRILQSTKRHINSTQ